MFLKETPIKFLFFGRERVPLQLQTYRNRIPINSMLKYYLFGKDFNKFIFLAKISTEKNRINLREPKDVPITCFIEDRVYKNFSTVCLCAVELHLNNNNYTI